MKIFPCFKLASTAAYPRRKPFSSIISSQYICWFDWIAKLHFSVVYGKTMENEKTISLFWKKLFLKIKAFVDTNTIIIIIRSFTECLNESMDVLQAIIHWSIKCLFFIHATLKWFSFKFSSLHNKWNNLSRKFRAISTTHNHNQSRIENRKKNILYCKDLC